MQQLLLYSYIHYQTSKKRRKITLLIGTYIRGTLRTCKVNINSSLTEVLHILLDSTNSQPTTKIHITWPMPPHYQFHFAPQSEHQQEQPFRRLCLCEQ